MASQGLLGLVGRLVLLWPAVPLPPLGPGRCRNRRSIQNQFECCYIISILLFPILKLCRYPLGSHLPRWWCRNRKSFYKESNEVNSSNFSIKFQLNYYPRFKNICCDPPGFHPPANADHMDPEMKALVPVVPNKRCPNVKHPHHYTHCQERDHGSCVLRISMCEFVNCFLTQDTALFTSFGHKAFAPRGEFLTDDDEIRLQGPAQTIASKTWGQRGRSLRWPFPCF